MPKRYNSKGKEILILELLYRRGKAKFKEIRDYLKKETSCANSTIIARLKNLEKRGCIKKDGRGVYTITGKGIREYEEEKPAKEVQKIKKHFGSLRDFEANLAAVRDLKQSFAYSIFIFGKIENEVGPKEIIREIDKNFVEEEYGCYKVYFIEKFGISYLIQVFPQSFSLFGALSGVLPWKVIDYGAVTSWRFLFLGLSYYISLIGRICDLKRVKAVIEKAYFIDHKRDEYLRDDGEKNWMDYIMEKVRFGDLPKYKLPKKVSMQPFKMDERMRSLWKKFCERFDGEHRDAKVSIVFDFRTGKEYLEVCERMDFGKTSEEKYFIIICGGVCRVVINYDWLKELNDENIISTLDRISTQCIQGVERTSEIAQS